MAVGGQAQSTEDDLARALQSLGEGSEDRSVMVPNEGRLTG